MKQTLRLKHGDDQTATLNNVSFADTKLPHSPCVPTSMVIVLLFRKENDE